MSLLHLSALLLGRIEIIDDTRFILANFLGKSKNILKIFKQDRINASLSFTTIYTLTALLYKYTILYFKLNKCCFQFASNISIVLCVFNCIVINVFWRLLWIYLGHVRLISFVHLAPWSACCLLALFHCMVRYGSARLGSVRLSSGRFAFPPQFSTAIEWAGLLTRRYNCAASTAVTSS